MSSTTWKRLLWLATCGVFVACASAPAPTPTKKKKKKKRSKDKVALKKKKEEKRDDEEQPDKPSKADKEDKADEDTVIVSDESDEETATKKKKKAKDEKKDEEVAAKSKKKKKDDEENSSKKDPADEETEESAVKKKKKAKDEEDGEEVASKSKKKKDEAKRKKKEAEEEEARKKKEAEEEELARKEAEEEARKQKEEEELAAKAKKKKKKKSDETKVAAKENGDEEEPADEEVAEEEPKAKKKKSVKVAKAAKKNADVDMTSDENTIDMEDESSGSSLDSRVEDQPPERRAVAIAVPGVDDDSGGEVAADTTPLGTNPLVINERPLVLPKGKLAVHGGLRVGVLTLPNAAGMTTSTTSTGLALGVNYGASDDAEIGLDYTAGLSPGSAKGPVTLHAAYNAIKGKLDMAVAGALAVDFSPATMTVPSKASFALELGAWARYRVSRKASVFSGVPALPNSTVSLTKLSFPLPPLPYQLAIGLNNAGTIALDLPVGVAYQATPKIYAFGLLDLAHIRIANTE
ncbi:MAG TPA: hypothetical protein VFV99_12695, partial [Kofleriaceae bacterium]|nr:hypothetical protein [Kofleriaceae bacterium]